MKMRVKFFEKDERNKKKGKVVGIKISKFIGDMNK